MRNQRMKNLMDILAMETLNDNEETVAEFSKLIVENPVLGKIVYNNSIIHGGTNK